jgi:hypothetical protein
LRIGCLIAAGACLGCGGAAGDTPELNHVRGRVTLDGKPLPNASVVFTPRAGGRSTYSITDEHGDYELGYSTAAEGTPPGEYLVSIRTGRVAEEDLNTGQTLPAVPETVPSVYNVKSSLTMKVPAEDGEYDFQLKSDAGEIVQPVPEPA